MKRLSGVWPVLLFLLCLVVSVQFVSADVKFNDTYRDAQSGYTIDVPNSWENKEYDNQDLEGTTYKSVVFYPSSEQYSRQTRSVNTYFGKTSVILGIEKSAVGTLSEEEKADVFMNLLAQSRINFSVKKIEKKIVGQTLLYTLHSQYISLDQEVVYAIDAVAFKGDSAFLFQGASLVSSNGSKEYILAMLDSITFSK